MKLRFGEIGGIKMLRLSVAYTFNICVKYFRLQAVTANKNGVGVEVLNITKCIAFNLL
jgi:hypothetical protein